MDSLDLPAVAAVGGWIATDLVDITDDVAALDATGRWVVVLPYDSPPVCARFARWRRGELTASRPWSGPATDGWATSLDLDAHAKRVAAIREAIAAGGVYQVNLTRRLSASLRGSEDVVALGVALASQNPAPHSAIVRLPSAGMHVACASPERFLSRSGRTVESRPIKGTAADVSGFLAKDRAENVMIVDLVRNDLGRICEIGSVRVPGLCDVEAHPGLFHLVSTVRGTLRDDVGWAEIVEATFPPGSVTGAPKLAAVALISALEPVPRGPYCGAIGWVDADRLQADLSVAIRTFWFAAGDVHLGTGGAVTWDSDAAGEWAETELKASRLLAAASSVPAGVR